jgi:hypothetical protein
MKSSAWMIGQLIVSTCIALLSIALPSVTAQPKAPYLNKNPGGLPPFFASMEKHEVMVSVQIRKSGNTLSKASAQLQVGFRILAQGAKIRDYHEETDVEGRAFFLGIPSNPKVQMAITYEVWVDYKGVRFPFHLKGIPSTVNKDVLYDDFDPKKRLPENRISLIIQEPSRGLEGISLHHDLIEFHPDEESLLVIHEMTLKNSGDRLIDLSHQPNGGLKLPAPIGAKKPELHQSHHDELEIRGAALYYIGALLPYGTKTIKWYYTIPYRSSRYSWSQSMPIPTTVGMVVAPRFKKPQHQRVFPLSLETSALGEVREVNTGPNKIFHSLRINESLKAGQPLTFKVSGLPIPPPWKRYTLYSAVVAVILLVLLLGSKSDQISGQVSRTHLLIERDRLLRALARMEIALKKKRITPQRYQREREMITARLVTLYRALDQVDQAV